MTLDYFAELGRAGGRFPDLKDADAVTTCYHLLAAAGHKKDKDTGADALRAAWGKGRLDVSIPKSDNAVWRPIAEPTFDLTILPACSFSLSFTFTLAQPYLSKDDNAFYIIDNPIVRDKVFGLPLVRPSSWKGNLAAALRQLGQRETDAPWQRLFGKVNESDDEGQAGRLIFFPTFFTQTGLEIINPHDRKTKVGKNPILFESVPIGTKGVFTLLYVPFDRVGDGEAETRCEVAQDLSWLAEGLQAMFTVYGFSAKRTSGFGVAEESTKGGQLALKMIDRRPRAIQDSRAPAADTSALDAEIAAFVQRFGLSEFPRWTNAEAEASGWGGKRQSEYKRLRRRHLDWDEAGHVWRAQPVISEAEPQAPEPPTPPALTSREFSSFTELQQVAAELSQVSGGPSGGVQ